MQTLPRQEWDGWLITQQTSSQLSKYRYADFTTSYIFQPITVENLDPINSSALAFLSNLGHRTCTVSSDDKKALFLFQRIFVTIQRFNSVLLHDSFCIDCPDQ